VSGLLSDLSDLAGARQFADSDLGTCRRRTQRYEGTAKQTIIYQVFKKIASLFR